VTDGLRMVVARPSNYGDMLVERQTPVEDDTNTFMSSATGRSTPATDTDEH